MELSKIILLLAVFSMPGFLHCMGLVEGETCEKMCGVGQYLERELACECHSCPEGTFLKETSHQIKSCSPCQVPDINANQVVKEKCTATSNSKLGCRPGYFVDADHEGPECTRCTDCSYNTNDTVYEGKACDEHYDTVCCSEPNMDVKEEGDQFVCVAKEKLIEELLSAGNEERNRRSPHELCPPALEGQPYTLSCSGETSSHNRNVNWERTTAEHFFVTVSMCRQNSNLPECRSSRSEVYESCLQSYGSEPLYSANSCIHTNSSGNYFSTSLTVTNMTRQDDGMIFQCKSLDFVSKMIKIHFSCQIKIEEPQNNDKNGEVRMEAPLASNEIDGRYLLSTVSSYPEPQRSSSQTIMIHITCRPMPILILLFVLSGVVSAAM